VGRRQERCDGGGIVITNPRARDADREQDADHHQGAGNQTPADAPAAPSCGVHDGAETAQAPCFVDSRKAGSRSWRGQREGREGRSSEPATAAG